jgi:hypothetical protein
MRERLMQMLDVVSLVKAVRNAMIDLDRPSAFGVMIFSFLGTLVTGAYTWVVDWQPTWRFANGQDPSEIIYTPTSVADAMIGNVDAMVGVVNGLATITLGAFIGGSLAVGITLLPTIVQFIAPKVMHPMAKTGMDIAIGFDFVTDWPSAGVQASYITTNPIGQFLATLGLVFFYSLVLQSFFVLFFAAFAMSVIILLAGDPPKRRVAPQTINA